MNYIAISVAAATRMLLQRGLFDLNADGHLLVRLLKNGLATGTSWRNFALECSDEVLYIGLTNERVDHTLFIGPSVFGGLSDENDLLTIADRALRVFVTIARNSAPNKSWRKYTAGSLLTVFATPVPEPQQRRLCFDLSTKSRDSVVALYELLPLAEVDDLRSHPPSKRFSADNERLAKLIPTLAERAVSATDSSQSSVISDHRAPAKYGQSIADNIARGTPLDQWMPRLDDVQRAFIGNTVEGPLRLHGTAGTGKTLTLLIKALTEVARASEDARLAIVAHSSPMQDALATALEALDPDGTVRGGSARLESLTLFDWCVRFLGSELAPVQLIDKDAVESREYQRSLLKRCLDDQYESVWRSHRAQCSPEFRIAVERERNEPWFLTLLQHEVACVIKGNRVPPYNLQAYLELSRPVHAMPLKNEGDRRFVFGVYKEYEEILREFGVFDVDDVVIEVLGRLESPLWNRQRHGRGYDVIFIDEAHLLNDNERSLVRNLLKETDSLPRIVMVLDLLQSVGDAGVREDSHGRLVTPTTIDESRRSELGELYRSTLQILELARSVVTVGSELYDVPCIGTLSTNSTGDFPEFAKLSSLPAQAEAAFATAERWRKQYSWRPSDIALIAVTAEAFASVEDFSVQNNKSLRIVDRRADQTVFGDVMRSPGFVLTTPEFAAGLQFQGAIIIDVSEGRFPDVRSAVAGARAAMHRRAVSELYLALTRVQQRVLVLVDSGSGPSELLKPAIAAGRIMPQTSGS